MRPGQSCIRDVDISLSDGVVLFHRMIPTREDSPIVSPDTSVNSRSIGGPGKASSHAALCKKGGEDGTQNQKHGIWDNL